MGELADIGVSDDMFRKLRDTFSKHLAKSRQSLLQQCKELTAVCNQAKQEVSKWRADVKTFFDEGVVEAYKEKKLDTKKYHFLMSAKTAAAEAEKKGRKHAQELKAIFAEIQKQQKVIKPLVQ